MGKFPEKKKERKKHREGTMENCKEIRDTVIRMQQYRSAGTQTLLGPVLKEQSPSFG